MLDIFPLYLFPAACLMQVSFCTAESSGSQGCMEAVKGVHHNLAGLHSSFGFYYSFSLVARLLDILTGHNLQGADGILVPGGFGDRGVEGKILASKYARENKVPFLGICLGMQIAVIEFARSVLNLKDANSTEFDTSTKNPCVIFMPEVFSNEVFFFGCTIVFIPSYALLFLILCYYLRFLKHIWVEPCALVLGEHIFRLWIASLQNCKYLCFEIDK